MLNRTATVTTQNGYSWTTSINGTDESICKYFLGKSFHTAPYPQEVLSVAISVCIDGQEYTLDDLLNSRYSIQPIALGI